MESNLHKLFQLSNAESSRRAQMDIQIRKILQTLGCSLKMITFPIPLNRFAQFAQGCSMFIFHLTVQTASTLNNSNQYFLRAAAHGLFKHFWVKDVWAAQGGNTGDGRRRPQCIIIITKTSGNYTTLRSYTALSLWALSGQVWAD